MDDRVERILCWNCGRCYLLFRRAKCPYCIVIVGQKSTYANIPALPEGYFSDDSE